MNTVVGTTCKKINSVKCKNDEILNDFGHAQPVSVLVLALFCFYVCLVMLGAADILRCFTWFYK